MSDESWSPWKRHDGTCIPEPRGTVVQALLRDPEGCRYFHTGVVLISDGASWLWATSVRDPSADEIHCYRARRYPSGQKLIDEVATNMRANRRRRPAPVVARDTAITAAGS